MFTYPMSNRDALKAVTGLFSDQAFIDPVLNKFYLDQQKGLCTIEFRRHGAIATTPRHEILVTYLDPEEEIMAQLSA